MADARFAVIANKLLLAAAAAHGALAPTAAAGSHIDRQKGSCALRVARVTSQPTKFVGARRHRSVTIVALIAQRPSEGVLACAATIRSEGVIVKGNGAQPVAIVPLPPAILVGAGRVAGEAVGALITEVPHNVCFACAAATRPKGVTVVRGRGLHVASVADAITVLVGAARKGAVAVGTLVASGADNIFLACAAAVWAKGIFVESSGAFSIARVALQPTILVGASRHRSVTIGALIAQRPSEGVLACAAAIRPEGVFVEGNGAQPVAIVPLPPAILVGASGVAGEAVGALITEVPHYVCFACAAAAGPKGVTVVRGRCLHVAIVADAITVLVAAARKGTVTVSALVASGAGDVCFACAAAVGPGTVGVVRNCPLRIACVANAGAPLHLTGSPREALRAGTALRPSPVRLACAAGASRYPTVNVND